MVRPVEPEPPDALRRVYDRVKRADATPDKLGHQQVKERQQKSGHHHEEQPDQKMDADQVIIGSRGEGDASEHAEDVKAPVNPTQADSDDTHHLDVKG
jgi:hypothetical protein